MIKSAADADFDRVTRHGEIAQFELSKIGLRDWTDSTRGQLVAKDVDHLSQHTLVAYGTGLSERAPDTLRRANQSWVGVTEILHHSFTVVNLLD